MDKKVTIEFFNKRTKFLDKVEFSQSEWKNIVRYCNLGGVPLNCRVL